MATTNPNHVQSGISEDCSSCHPVNAFQWTGAGFSHAIFPLVQGHSALKCTDCHKTTSYSSASLVCNDCHQQDFLAAKNPDHSVSHFSTNCQDCHTLTPGWKPANFNHSGFPLTLGHSIPACIDCHKNGNYTTTPTDCYACHQQDFVATTNPNHVSSGFATTCLTCHTTNPGWKPASFNHSVFPLTLGHSTPACTDCHKGGNYTTTPTDCYTCHQTDYNNATNPNHKTLNFSTTCTQCHTTVPGWKPATYTQHDAQFFPIYSGRHKGQWDACGDCHTNAANYALFDCIHCHTNVHRGNNYTNSQCYSCHPRGTSD
jgi:nitrate/TMAO reductase-like tetraheme cytochrome c subunit